MASELVDVAYIQEYSDKLIMLAAQKGSRLVSRIYNDPFAAKNMYFDRLGSSEAKEITSRETPAETTETPHSRRRLNFRHFYLKEAISHVDQLRMKLDFTNPILMRQAEALGRKQDEVIIGAALGSAYAVDENESTSGVVLPSGQKVTVSYDSSNTSLTIAKLIRMQEIFAANEVDGDEEKILVVNAKALSGLLSTTQAQSHDYNSVRPLVDGKINQFMGFTFIRSERLPIASNARSCFAFVKSGIAGTLGTENFSKVYEDEDHHFDKVMYSRIAFGATRLEEEKVVMVETYEA